MLPGHRPGELGRLCAQVVREHRVESLRPVPLQAVQVVPHGVEVVLGEDVVGLVHQGGLAGQSSVVLVYVLDQAVVVVVVPLRVQSHRPPGQVPLEDGPPGEEVVGHGTLDAPVVAEDETEVGREREELLPLVVGLQVVLPALVFLPGHVHAVEVLDHVAHQDAVHLPVLPRGLLHVEEGRQPVGRRVDVCVLVLGPVEVEAHQVEGVDELLAAGVGPVVGVQPLVLVDDGAAFRGALRIRPAVRVAGGDVHLREEGRDGLRDRVGPAEGADDATLLDRILLPGAGLPGDGLRHPLADGPLERVAPVGVGVQDTVCIGRFALPGLVDEVHVGRRRGPVHEAGRLVGGVVEEVDADVVGEPPGDGDVFVRGHLPGERHYDAVARFAWRVAVGGVEAPGGAVQHLPDGLDGGGCAEVDVEGDEGAGGDGVSLAPAPVADGAADEAADVLDLALGRLRHRPVFGRGLAGVLAFGEPCGQLLPRGGLVGPLRRGA